MVRFWSALSMYIVHNLRSTTARSGALKASEALRLPAARWLISLCYCFCSRAVCRIARLDGDEVRCAGERRKWVLSTERRSIKHFHSNNGVNEPTQVKENISYQKNDRTEIGNKQSLQSVIVTRLTQWRRNICRRSTAGNGRWSSTNGLRWQRVHRPRHEQTR